MCEPLQQLAESCLKRGISIDRAKHRAQRYSLVAVEVGEARRLAADDLAVRAGLLKLSRAVRVEVRGAGRLLAVRRRGDGEGDVEAVDERNVIPVRVAVAAERPLRDGRGRDTRAGVLRALEAAVAAAGLAGGGARVGAEVAGRALPDAASGPVVGDVEGDLLARALLPAAECVRTVFGEDMKDIAYPVAWSGTAEPAFRSVKRPGQTVNAQLFLTVNLRAVAAATRSERTAKLFMVCVK